MAAFSGLLKKASEKATDVLQNLRIGNNRDSTKFPGKEGDIIYSKNNVCVHPAVVSDVDTVHVPGYLTLHCQKDEALGITLILQWLPNATLEKNPRSIRTISPRNSPHCSQTASPRSRVKLRHLHGNQQRRQRSSSDSSSSPVQETGDSQSVTTPTSEDGESSNNPATSGKLSQRPPDIVTATEPQISVEMTGDNLTITQETPSGRQRPQFLDTAPSDGLSAPCINVIPNTPTPTLHEMGPRDLGAKQKNDDAESPTTSGADDGSGPEDDEMPRGDKNDQHHSSSYSSGSEGGPDTPTQGEQEASSISALLLSYKNNDFLEKSPEEFAQLRNMILPDGVITSGDQSEHVNSVTGNDENATTVLTNKTSKNNNLCLFSVDLGQMRSFRLFYSNPEYTSGQLVIASPRSQYKILHFHHGGLDKLSQIFEQWSVLRAKSVKKSQFAVLRPQLTKGEQHPEEGLYDQVTWEFWRSCTNADGAIEDDLTLRKVIFFGGLDVTLRKEAWPFLLHVYPWNSTREQRDHIRNDLFLEYQNVRKRRLKGALKMGAKTWQYVESTISKDVVRTDRRNPYYKGDGNPNLETMKNILLNYAAFCPQIGYIQGMSDLLASILVVVQEESDAFWCFAGLMQRTIFVSAPRNNNNMDRNLEYLRVLLKVMHPEFYQHLIDIGGDSLQLLFTHRWILLCFKREFPETDALRIWEACWANFQTCYFHLFTCLAIMTIYGQDVVLQKLPHDEILLYFSSLAMHMNADTVLQKARGLLYQFERLETIPCTLAGVCDWQTLGMWDAAHLQPTIECVQMHGDSDVCPYSSSDQNA